MSKSSNQEFHSWKVLEDRLRGDVFLHHGSELSKRDNATIALAFLLQGMMLEDLLADGPHDRRSRIRRWLSSCHLWDIYELSKFLKEMNVFFRNFPEDAFMTYNDFKRHFRTSFPFVGDFMSPIKEEVEAFLGSPSSSSFRVINQHVNFLVRVSLVDIDFSNQCLTEYVHQEHILAGSELDSQSLARLNKIAREWFSDCVFPDFVPRHGNGGVAKLGRSSLKRKYCALGLDDLLRYVLHSYGDPLTFLPEPPVRVERTCQVEFVPKSLQTWRTISMEPATLQYFQQGVFRSLDRFLGDHFRLSSIVHLHDQTFNQDLAREGSRFGLYSTIDLSNASDSVSWELVRNVFRGTPLLRWFYATRSRQARLPNGDVLDLHKFAPMGSALCFPVECIVFSLICEDTARQLGHAPDKLRYLVYGDDIVFPTSGVLDLVENLVGFGFTVNTSKSFTSYRLPFRESCGGEYFRGDDVSPFRLSRKFSAEDPTRWNPNVVKNHISMANLAHEHGFRTVRRWVISRLLSLPKDLRPRFSEDMRHLYSPTPSNFHLETRWSNDWQCDLLRCGEIVTTFEHHGHADDALRLFEWLRQAEYSPRDVFSEAISANVARSSTRLRSRLVSNS